MKLKLFVLLIILLSPYSYSQGVEKKIMPEEIRRLLENVGRDDPFVPPQKGYRTSLPVTEKSQLEGIIWSEDKPMAIINGEIVGEGQIIGDKKIIKIEKDSVIVESQDGERYTIELH